ncbi:MAG: class I SAM-dependent methyltransferase [Alphaproteobacteria bacterium]
MTDAPTSSDWAGARGEKWQRQLAPMEAMLSAVTAPLISALALEGPCRVADIGCGGGAATLEIARQAPEGSAVTGLDISPALIASARMPAPPAGRQVTFEVADMATAEPSTPFDRLASRFGVMFFDHPPAAFSNMARWLAPGGRFAFAVWGPPANNPWMTAAREAVAQVADLPPRDPDGPGPFRYGDVDHLIRLLTIAGFEGVRADEWRGRLEMGGGLDAPGAADFALNAFSVGDVLADAGPAAAARARSALIARYRDHLQDGVVTMEAHVHIVTGVRPS